MGRLVIFLLFFTLTPLTLFASLFLSLSHNSSGVLGIATVKNRPFAYAALPMNDNIFAGSATLSDSRLGSVESFLQTYHSPLTPYASEIVSKADEYGIDYRLLPAIAMQETTLCKKTLPSAPFNCFGFGVWGKRITNFSSLADAIDVVSHYFGNKKLRGISTLDEIATIYNPSNTNHWKENVASFMSQL